jgi:hypothetical protein
VLDRECAVALPCPGLVGLVLRGAAGIGRGSSLIKRSRPTISLSSEGSTKDGFGRGEGRRSSGGCIVWLKGESAGELENDGLLVVMGSFGGDSDRTRSVVHVNRSSPIFNCAVKHDARGLTRPSSLSFPPPLENLLLQFASALLIFPVTLDLEACNSF